MAQGIRHVWSLLGVSVCALGQTPTATLVGTVRDSTGAVIAGASVTVRNLDTGEARRTGTTDAGDFTLANLPPGAWELTAEQPGFKRIREPQIDLQVDQVARLDLMLPLGDVAESVEVRAEASLLNTETSARGEVISSKEIAEMPLDGRDFADLAFLVPGVTRRAQGGQGSAFSVNGARGDSTAFLIDGFNDQNPRAGGVMARPPIDAMQEFKMQVSNYPAEFGRLPGGVMNMVLKTGGNRFHGTLFEYLRNDRLDARDYFDEAKSKLRRNQFGGTLNGPLRRDRTFFLASWESYRQIFGSNRLGRVPTERERAGDFTQTIDTVTGRTVALRDPLASGTCSATEMGGCFPGNVIPPSRFHPTAPQVAAYYPSPNRPGQANNFRTNFNDADAWNSFLGKIDHRFSEKDTLSARFLTRRNDLNSPFTGSDLGTFGSTVNEAQSLGGITHTRLISSSVVNEFRAGFSRTRRLELPVHTGQDFNSQFGIPGPSDPFLQGFPKFTIRDLLTIGNAEGYPQKYAVTNYEIGDTFTLVRSRHESSLAGTSCARISTSRRSTTCGGSSISWDAGPTPPTATSCSVFSTTPAAGRLPRTVTCAPGTPARSRRTTSS